MRQTSLALFTLACAAELSLGACLRADAPPAAGEGDDGVKTPSQGWGELPADHEVGDELDEGVSPSEATSAAGDCSQRWSLPSEVSNAGLAQRVPYAGADECSGGATQGARQLGDDLRERFTSSINLDVEGDGVQIYACRNINGGSGLSVHATGRAIDLFIPTDGGAADNALGDVVAHWLVRNAELVGVQLLIWDRTIWKPGEGDRCYGGAHPHNDHIHIELSEAAGDLRTPYFQGEPAPQDPDPQDPDPQDPDPQDPPDPVDPDPQDLSPIPGAWVGTPCVADSQCGFTHEGVRARCYLERNPSFGVCTLPCEGFCPDRQGHAVTFCASNDDLQGRSGGGFCMARAEDSNGFCVGMSRVSAARWVGASGAPAAQREVCAPNLGQGDPQDPVDPEPQDGIWRPSPTATWQIQYSGDSLDTSPNVQVFNLDLFDTEQSVIDGLKRRGVAVVCYFSAGSSEDWRPDFASFPAAALGEPLDGWAGERWLDIRSSQIRQIMTRRLDLAAQKGCDAVDPDNVNGWDNDTGFNLSPADQLDFNRFLAREAHARGLSIGLKNDQDQAADLVDHFDWALNEECIAQNNCTPYLTTFVAQGKAVFNVEYEGSASRVCDISNLIGLNTLLKTLDLGPERTACR